MNQEKQGGISPERTDEELPKRGPLGDVLPGREETDPRTRGGQPQEPVEDRPNVGTVKPEDYPEQQ